MFDGVGVGGVFVFFFRLFNQLDAMHGLQLCSLIQQSSDELYAPHTSKKKKIKHKLKSDKIKVKYDCSTAL